MFIYNLYNKLFSNSYEKAAIMLLKKLRLDREICIVDIGSYIGKFSENINKNININIKKNFFLIDPNPYIKDKIILDFKYKFFNLAINNSRSKKILYFNEAFPAAGTSLKKYIFSDNMYNWSRKIFFIRKKNLFKKIKVKTQYLDDFVFKNKIKKIDILKLDTEGNELNIFKSGKKSLKNIKLICVEVMDSKKNITNDKKIKNIQKVLGNDFVLKYKKRILSVSIFSNIVCYDLIFINKSYSR